MAKDRFLKSLLRWQPSKINSAGSILVFKIRQLSKQKKGHKVRVPRSCRGCLQSSRQLSRFLRSLNKSASTGGSIFTGKRFWHPAPAMVTKLLTCCKRQLMLTGESILTTATYPKLL